MVAIYEADALGLRAALEHLRAAFELEVFDEDDRVAIGEDIAKGVFDDALACCAFGLGFGLPLVAARHTLPLVAVLQKVIHFTHRASRFLTHNAGEDTVRGERVATAGFRFGAKGGRVLPLFPMQPVRHLYVHIPFCPKVCPYCAFYKEASDRNMTAKFLESVLAELDAFYARGGALQPETIFFGGGTPSALSTSQLDFLLTGLNERLDLSALREWTLEMNPATVSLEKARLLRSLGVNRISMGVQSWDPALLEVLGRVHSAEQAERSYAILREAGFENVNLDLIFAVPTQTREQWRASLEKTISLVPEHLSAYCLTYEEDTAFYARFQKGEWSVDEAWDADLFEMTMDLLGEAGYAQYEISNYARPGRECAHNLAYWLGADYLGLGPSAYSTCGTRRWQNVPDTAGYTRSILAGEAATGFEEAVDPATRRAEAIAFGLRTGFGVPDEWLAPWPETTAEYLEEGFFLRAEGRTRLTRRGKMVADRLAEAFI